MAMLMKAMAMAAAIAEAGNNVPSAQLSDMGSSLQWAGSDGDIRRNSECERSERLFDIEKHHVIAPVIKGSFDYYDNLWKCLNDSDAKNYLQKHTRAALLPTSANVTT